MGPVVGEGRCPRSRRPRRWPWLARRAPLPLAAPSRRMALVCGSARRARVAWLVRAARLGVRALWALRLRLPSFASRGILVAHVRLGSDGSACAALGSSPTPPSHIAAPSLRLCARTAARAGGSARCTRLCALLHRRRRLLRRPRCGCTRVAWLVRVAQLGVRGVVGSAPPPPFVTCAPHVMRGRDRTKKCVPTISCGPHCVCVWGGGGGSAATPGDLYGNARGF